MNPGKEILYDRTFPFSCKRFKKAFKVVDSFKVSVNCLFKR